MRKIISAGMLLSTMVASSSLLAQTSSDEVAQLKQRVAQLEKQVQEMSRNTQLKKSIN